MANDEEIPIGTSLSLGNLSGGVLYSWPSAPTTTTTPQAASATTQVVSPPSTTATPQAASATTKVVAPPVTQASGQAASAPATSISDILGRIESLSPNIESIGTSTVPVSEPSSSAENVLTLQQAAPQQASPSLSSDQVTAAQLMVVYDSMAACRSPSEIVKITGLSAGVVNSCISVLIAKGWIAQDEAKRYCSIEAAKKLKDKLRKFCEFCQG